MSHSVTRRKLLAAGAGTVSAAVAGCLGDVATGGGQSGDTLESTDGTGELGVPATAVNVELSSRPVPTIEPAIVHIEPGGTVEWVGTGIRNAVAAYHPETHGPLRMPDAAEPWVSKMLYEEQTYAVTLETEGVYDYADTVVLCGTHESLGAIGRIVVGDPDLDAEPALQADPAALPGRAEAVAQEFNERCRAVLG